VQVECQFAPYGNDRYNLNMEKIEHIRQWLGTGSINIFGIQFSGKDTVGKHLAALLDAEFLSSGDIMRATFAESMPSTDDKIWQAAKVGSTVGQLMPTDEFQVMMTRRLAQDDLVGKSLVLSSVGRWIGEEVPVMEALRREKHDTKAVILLNVSDDEVFRRWELSEHPDARNVGRADEDEEQLHRRIEWFRDKTVPVIEVYRSMGLLREVNGEQPREKVFSDVIDALYDASRA
jgi:adenylate kinase